MMEYFVKGYIGFCRRCSGSITDGDWVLYRKWFHLDVVQILSSDDEDNQAAQQSASQAVVPQSSAPSSGATPSTATVSQDGQEKHCDAVVTISRCIGKFNARALINLACNGLITFSIVK